MRGHTFLSYALVAIASTVIAAPVDHVEKREMSYPGGPLAKVGTVNVGKEYYHRRQEAEAAYVRHS